MVSRKVPTSLNLAKVFTMTTPRIYTYKITFEEVPYWYWGVHKERKYGKTYLGSPKTHKWIWEFYTPKIQILEFFPYTDEGWEEANRVEARLIKPDINNPLCLNENCGGCISLACRSEGGKIGGKKTHESKDGNGKSLHSLKVNKKLHEAKDGNGKSLVAVKAGKEGGKIGAVKTNTQIWESTIDGFRSNAGAVARHNKARGWDPNDRIRIS